MEEPNTETEGEKVLSTSDITTDEIYDVVLRQFLREHPELNTRRPSPKKEKEVQTAAQAAAQTAAQIATVQRRQRKATDALLKRRIQRAMMNPWQDYATSHAAYHAAHGEMSEEDENNPQLNGDDYYNRVIRSRFRSLNPEEVVVELEDFPAIMELSTPTFVYLEKSLALNDMTLTAFAKNLPYDKKHSSNMVQVNFMIHKNTAYFVRTGEDLSLLLAEGGKYQNDALEFTTQGAFGTMEVEAPMKLRPYKKKKTTRRMDTGAQSNSRAEDTLEAPEEELPQIPKLEFNHPDIRKTVRSIELGIRTPHSRFMSSLNENLSDDRRHAMLMDSPDATDAILDKRLTSYVKVLSNLASELASFENLKFVRIVLINIGRGQKFSDGGIGEIVLCPLFKLLGKKGFHLGIQLQLWGSLKAKQSKLTGRMEVEDFRRPFHPSEARDFRDAILPRFSPSHGERLRYQVMNNMSDFSAVTPGEMAWIEAEADPENMFREDFDMVSDKQSVVSGHVSIFGGP